jgi:hypothetical protein
MRSVVLPGTRCADCFIQDHVLSTDIFPKPFVTEVDLRAALLPPTAVEYLQQAMPRRPGSETEFDYEAWLDDVFA